MIPNTQANLHLYICTYLHSGSVSVLDAKAIGFQYQHQASYGLTQHQCHIIMYHRPGPSLVLGYNVQGPVMRSTALQLLQMLLVAVMTIAMGHSGSEVYIVKP